MTEPTLDERCEHCQEFAREQADDCIYGTCEVCGEVLYGRSPGAMAEPTIDEHIDDAGGEEAVSGARSTEPMSYARLLELEYSTDIQEACSEIRRLRAENARLKDAVLRGENGGHSKKRFKFEIRGSDD